MKACVVGSGVSGLCAAKYLKDENKVQEVVVYESSGEIGGQWNYTDRVGVDEYGAPVHTSMYESLHVNIPTKTMEILGYTHPRDPCFPTREKIHEYLKNFAIEEDLLKYIKFHHEVTSVKKTGEKWQVLAKNFIENREELEDFDFIFICNGHYSKPHLPFFSGDNIFKGRIIHSHNYRKPQEFKDKTVLIVGFGPSGEDIARDLINHSKKTFLSQHSKRKTDIFDGHVTVKPDIKGFKEKSIIFDDDTEEEIDDIIYCTGYEYHYPFLDETCGLETDIHSIKPLYKHIVNINEPTMFFVNASSMISPFFSADIQSKYCVRLIGEHFQLPTKEAMLQIMQNEETEKKRLGIIDKRYHAMGYKERQYFNELADESRSKKTNQAALTMHRDAVSTRKTHPHNYRNCVYRIINNCNYTKCLDGEEEQNIAVVDCTDDV